MQQYKIMDKEKDVFAAEQTKMNTNLRGGSGLLNPSGTDRVENLQKIYNNQFYNDHKNETLCSAEVIVPLVLDVFPAQSVIDVGCGTGAWLSLFRKYGVSRIRGYDAARLSEEHYFIESENIVPDCDFSSPDFRISELCDIVSCLEVAEHLPDSASDCLIRTLTQTAPVVLFSAAFPGQTGVNHINEQPPWYWRKKFNTRGYIEMDCLRPHIWSDKRISWWYRQNITIYVRPDYLHSNSKAAQLSQRYPELKEPEKLTMISERILKKLLNAASSPAQQAVSQVGPSQSTPAIPDQQQDLLAGIQNDISHRDYNAALQKLDIAAGLYPTLSRIHFLRAVCYERLGQYADARCAIHAELKNTPGHEVSIRLLQSIEQNLKSSRPANQSEAADSNGWLRVLYKQ